MGDPDLNLNVPSAVASREAQARRLERKIQVTSELEARTHNEGARATHTTHIAGWRVQQERLRGKNEGDPSDGGSDHQPRLNTSRQQRARHWMTLKE